MATTTVHCFSPCPALHRFSRSRLSSPNGSASGFVTPMKRGSSFKKRALIGRPGRTQHSLEICCCIADSQKLSPKKLESILTEEGRIHSNEDERTKASVFAIFDQNKKLQYIGFSKGLRDTLRTVFTRRPDKAYYYKSANLTKLDQKEMVLIRDGWFNEVGGPPVGNKLALERAAWQQPVDVVVNGTGPKTKAAEDHAEKLIQQIKDRGCTEQFIPNPEFLLQGQVDLLLVDNITEEEMAEKKAKMEAVKEATRYAKTLFQEQESEFSVYFNQEILTNGGTMFDVFVSHNEQDSTHRIIVGDEYYAPHGLQPEDVVMLSFAFIISEELERQTEGLLLLTQFPINYFTVAELDQRYPEFREHFREWTGISLTGEKYWKFNRVENYGAALERLEGFESPLPKYGEKPLLAGYD